MTTLVLIPTRPDLHPALKARSRALASALIGDTEIVIDDRPGVGSPNAPWAERIAKSSAMRQALIDDHLKAHHTAVLWVDADIIAYPADLLVRLEAMGTENVTAPAALMDAPYPRWYDLAGFVENGEWASMFEPFFHQVPVDGIVTLDGVGMCYRVPADVYRQGGRHALINERYTDHWSVCVAAREQGRKVLCDLRIAAVHADLAKYGEAYH